MATDFDCYPQIPRPCSRTTLRGPHQLPRPHCSFISGCYFWPCVHFSFATAGSPCREHTKKLQGNRNIKMMAMGCHHDGNGLPS